MGKHIVLTTIGSLGDLHPMIALAIELEKRGHRTTIVTTEFYREKIEAIGLDFKPMRPNMSPDDPDLMRHVMDLKKGPEFIIRELFMPRLREMYDDLSDIASEADFIISGELVFATKVLAEQKGLKWAMAVLQPSAFFSAYDPSVLAPLPWTKYLRNAPTIFHQALLGIGKRMSKSWTKPLADLRRELGLTELDELLFHDKFSPHLNLAMFSQIIASPQPDWPENTVQTGFVFYDKQDHSAEIPAALAKFLDAGDPPLIFTLGSAAVRTAGMFYEESIRAVKKLNKRAILLVGQNELRQDLPDNIAVFDYIPFSEVLSRAACVIHQGGVGTTAQVLRAGVPQLVMPYSFDQPDNGARVERLGVGRTISRDKYNAASAVVLLNDLLGDPAYLQKARAISKIVVDENGIKDSCDAIEDLL